MNVSEWPLTLFTIFSQMAVGAFITLGVINILGRTKYNSQTIERLANFALFAIGPVMILGLLASIFHLGNPLNAINAIRNINSSWLAREIVFGATFAALGFAFALTQWFNWLTHTLRQILATITALVGLAFIWVMAHVYMLPTVPAWNHWTTPTNFYLSAALTGSLAIAVAFTSWPTITNKWPILDRTTNHQHTKQTKTRATSSKTSTEQAVKAKARQDVATLKEAQNLTNTTVKWIGISVVILLALQLATIIFAGGKTPSPNPAQVDFSPTWQIIRIALLIIGAGLMGLYLTLTSEHNRLTKHTNSLLTLALTSYLLVTTSEIIARFLFYGLNNRIGI